MGAPSTYSDAIADEICSAIASGESLNKICSLVGMPHQSTVFKWLAANESFSEKYARAREAQADFYAQQIVDIADEQSEVVREDGTKFDPDVQRDRLRVDARKWYASKVAPKKYGDRQEITHGGSIGLSQMTDAELEQRARGDVK